MCPVDRDASVKIEKKKKKERGGENDGRGGEGTLGREEESRAVGIEGGLNTLARRRRDVKLQEDPPRPHLTTTLEILTLGILV